MTATQRAPYTLTPVRRNPGNNPKSYPLAVRDDVAVDYEERLPADARAYLERFNNAVHAGDFRGWSEADFTQAQRREIWRDLRRMQRHAAPPGAHVPLDTETLESALTERLAMAPKVKAVPYPPLNEATSTTAMPLSGSPSLTPVPEAALPRIPMVGWYQTPEGWVAISAVIQGTRVMQQQIHCTPQLKQYAALALNQALMKKVVSPKAVLLNLDDEADE